MEISFASHSVIIDGQKKSINAKVTCSDNFVFVEHEVQSTQGVVNIFIDDATPKKGVTQSSKEFDISTTSSIKDEDIKVTIKHVTNRTKPRPSAYNGSSSKGKQKPL